MDGSAGRPTGEPVRGSTGGRKGAPSHKFLVHYVGDDVGVAVADVEKGEEVKAVYMDTEESVTLIARDAIPLGHKIALRNAAADSAVIEYRTRIGIARRAISAGEHVHTHNIRSARWSFVDSSLKGGAASDAGAANRVSA